MGNRVAFCTFTKEPETPPKEWIMSKKTNSNPPETGTLRLKTGLAEMLKGAPPGASRRRPTRP